jgi:hypothetical protein
MPVIVPKRGDDLGRKPDWLKLDPDEEFVRAYTGAATRQMVAGIVGAVVSIQAAIFGSIFSGPKPGSESGDSSPAVWIIASVVVALLIAIIGIGIVKLRGMGAVYLTTKALVFRHRGEWTALLLSNVSRVERIGMLGKYQVLVYSDHDAKPLIRIGTMAPSPIIDEITRWSDAAKISLRSKRF